MALPKFPTTVIGSWRRSVEVQRAMRDKRAGRITDEEFQAVAISAFHVYLGKEAVLIFFLMVNNDETIIFPLLLSI